MKRLISMRSAVQAFFAALVYFVVVYYPSGLWYVFLGAIVLGAVFGKIFCKWMCPVGLIKSLLSRNMSEDQAKLHMYNYYKVGCPISWVQGLLNKVSLFKIRKDETCTECGLCDKVCYISTFDKEKSIYHSNKERAQEAFNCSKCLACVEACPKNSLKFTFSLKGSNKVS